MTWWGLVSPLWSNKGQLSRDRRPVLSPNSWSVLDICTLSNSMFLYPILLDPLIIFSCKVIKVIVLDRYSNVLTDCESGSILVLCPWPWFFSHRSHSWIVTYNIILGVVTMTFGHIFRLSQRIESHRVRYPFMFTDFVDGDWTS